jgi:spore germination cell wall hydrolase CwlJ-like protein
VRVVSDDVYGALNIFAEARGEPFEGQVAVGNVVRERMRLKYASDGTVVGTVWKSNQFSWTLSSDPQRIRVMRVDDEDPAWVEAMTAWKASETTKVVPSGTVLYHAEHVNPWWAESSAVRFVKRIGRHLFYTEERA